MYIISGLVGSPCTPKSKLLRRRNVTPTVPYPKMRHASHDISHTSNDTTTEDQARFLTPRIAYDNDEDAYSLKVPSEENQFNDGIIEDTLSNVDNFGIKGFQYTVNTPKCHGSQENENSALVGGKKNTFLDNIMVMICTNTDTSPNKPVVDCPQLFQYALRITIEGFAFVC